jgi:hypothetical protein
LKVVSGASEAGMETDAMDPGAGSATKTYTGSVYVYNAESSAKGMAFILHDVTNGLNFATVALNVPAGHWTRVAVTGTIGGIDCRDLRLIVTADDNGVTFYCDGFQIEEQDYPTAWVDGRRGVTNGLQDDDLGYDFDFNYSFTDWSAGIWFWGPAVARCPSVDGTILDIGPSSSTPYSRLWRRSAAKDLIRWELGISGTTLTLDTGAGDVDWEDWNFIGVSFRTDPETGETRRTMRLINGSGSTTYADNTALALQIDAASKLYVGNTEQADHWIGHLGELMLFPFAVPVEVWDGIASTLGQVGDGSADAIPLPQWPRKLVTGDIEITQPIGSPARVYGRLFEGDVGGVDMIVGDGRTNLGAVSFTLEEV